MKHQTSTSTKNRVFYPLIIIGLCCLVFGLCMLFPQGSANAAQVTLAWDQSTGAAGYKIYSGTTSDSYTWVVDVGNTTSYTTGTLTDGYTYYFAATAYDASRLESDYSDEVSYNAVPCSYSISPTSASFTTSGGSGNIIVITQSGCAWSASSGVSWITITSGSTGSGSGTVAYSVASNSGAARSVVSTIAGKLFTFSQSGTQSYTIATSAGTGGSISPTGPISVTSGASQSFTITPNGGYQVSNITVDGASVGAVTSYTFSNVTANHTIAATFTTVTSSYALTLSRAGTGTGTVTISPTGTSFTAGTVVTLTATADASSTFAGWSGACSGTAATCQVTMNANTSVTANFTIKSYTITASAGNGGTISPSGSVSVAYGSSKTFTITPKSGYKVRYIMIDNGNYGALTSYTFTNIKAKHTIKAYFIRF